MKKHVLAFALLLTQVAGAHVVSKDIRLQYKQVPDHGIMGGGTTTLNVYSDGLVTYSTCRAMYPRPCVNQEVTRLDADTMDRINNEIEEARFGKVVTKTSQMHCMAMSYYTDKYTADNGEVFLRTSRLCSDPTINTSPAAEELVTLLNELRSQALGLSAKAR